MSDFLNMIAIAVSVGCVISVVILHILRKEPKYLVHYECPDKHSGCFSNDKKSPKCEECGKRMIKIEDK